MDYQKSSQKVILISRLWLIEQPMVTALLSSWEGKLGHLCLLSISSQSKVRKNCHTDQSNDKIITTDTKHTTWYSCNLGIMFGSKILRRWAQLSPQQVHQDLTSCKCLEVTFLDLSVSDQEKNMIGQKNPHTQLNVLGSLPNPSS